MTINPTDRDRQVWQEEFEDFVPERVFDAHIHLYNRSCLLPGTRFPATSVWQRFGGTFTKQQLLEWTAALELHQRGRVKAILPVLVGESDFFSDAHAAFGGIQALPTNPSAATMEKVFVHLCETTGDDSLAKLRAVFEICQAVGRSYGP